MGRNIIATGAILIGLSLTTPTVVWAYSPAQFNAVTTEEEAQVYKLREQEINQLRIVMGRRFAESRKPDILLRLSELYMEKYKYYFLKENQIHQEMIRQGAKPKKVDHVRSDEQLRAANAVCISILKSKVAYPKMDQVYYFLGYTNDELGKKKEAHKYYEVLISRFPRSSYAPEAYRNLAEAAFAQNKFKKALEYYEAAATFKNVPSYPRTLYKLAWAYFKMRRRSEALDTIKKVIELSGKDEKFVGLRDEALNDIVMFFSEAGKFADAKDYFEKISGGPELYIKALGKLSTLYERRGELRQAIRVNDTLIQEYADRHPELVFDMLGRNVEDHRKLKDVAGETKALEQLVDHVAKNSGKFGRDADTMVPYVRAKNYLRARATEIHKDARKEKTTKMYSRAADLYGLYLRSFLAKPADDKELKEASEIRAYRADALIAAGRESDAMVELEQNLRNPGDSKFRRESGATLINILIKKIDAARAKSALVADVEEKFIDITKVFEEVFPTDVLVPELGFKRARLAAAKSGPEGLSNEAKKKLSEFIEKFPNRPEALDAAHDLVADAVKRKDQDEAVELSRKFLANRALMAHDHAKRQDTTKYFQSVVARQSFENVQELEKSQKFDVAAAEFEKLARTSSDSEVVAKALNNAAVNFDKAGRTGDATRIYFELLGRQAGAKREATKGELKRLAAEKLWRGDYIDAAKLYLKLAQVKSGAAYPFTSDERLSFMRSSMNLFWGAGDYNQAFVASRTLLNDFCSPLSKTRDSRCHDVALDQVQIMLDSKRESEALGVLRGYAGTRSPLTRTAEAYFRVGKIYEVAHESRKAFAAYEQAAAIRNARSAVERRYAAHAAFLLVEPDFRRFAAMKLELPEAKLKAVTKQKLDLLERLVTKYSGVVKYGDGEWAIASFERLYDALALFARELESSPVPPRLTGEQVSAYQAGIRQITAPMHARALDYLKQGFKKGIELKVTTPTFIALSQRLSSRLPREYPPAHYPMVEDDLNAGFRVMGAFDKPSPDWRAGVAGRLASNSKSVDAWVELGNYELASNHLRLAKFMYEQALALNPKAPAALSNLAAILARQQQFIESNQGFERAADVSPLGRDVRLNYAKSLLAYHHFAPALEILKPLAARNPDDREITAAFGVAQLGAMQIGAAQKTLDLVGGAGSDAFTVSYNALVIQTVFSSKAEDRADALERIRKWRGKVRTLEQSQIDVVGGVK